MLVISSLLLVWDVKESPVVFHLMIYLVGWFLYLQFVNFTAIMSKNVTLSEKETAFAVAALMEIPIQYKAATEFGLVG